MKAPFRAAHQVGNPGPIFVRSAHRIDASVHRKEPPPSMCSIGPASRPTVSAALGRKRPARMPGTPCCSSQSSPTHRASTRPYRHHRPSPCNRAGVEQAPCRWGIFGRSAPAAPSAIRVRQRALATPRPRARSQVAAENPRPAVQPIRKRQRQDCPRAPPPPAGARSGTRSGGAEGGTYSHDWTLRTKPTAGRRLSAL